MHVEVTGSLAVATSQGKHDQCDALCLCVSTCRKPYRYHGTAVYGFVGQQHRQLATCKGIAD